MEQGSPLVGYHRWEHSGESLTAEDSATVSHNPSPSMLLLFAAAAAADYFIITSNALDERLGDQFGDDIVSEKAVAAQAVPRITLSKDRPLLATLLAE